jgi:hypothetical protein
VRRVIRDIYLSAYDPNEVVQYEPPPRLLNLTVIGEDVELVVYENNDDDTIGKKRFSVKVDARSLHTALTAAIDDSDAGRARRRPAVSD